MAMEETDALQQLHQQAQEQDDYPRQCHNLVCNWKENDESSFVQKQSRMPNLSYLLKPERSMENTLSNFMTIDIPSHGPSPSSTGAGLPPRTNSAKLKSSGRNLLPQGSFRAKYLSQCGEKTVLDIPDTPMLDKPSTSMTCSLSKVFSSSKKSAQSLPVSPVANLGPQTAMETYLDGHSEISKPEIQPHMMRSSSAPVNLKTRSLRRMGSTGVLIRVMSATPRPAIVDGATETEIASEDAGEDIPEEEAVCRICLLELSEGGETLKMQCSCKGELALAHQECAVKWFTIKGNKTCDVCKKDVTNLPVILLKTQNPQTLRRRPPASLPQREFTLYRVWQDVTVLVTVSVLAYFCFLEQLMVSDLGSRALAISLPFACVLGLLSSMIASTIVSKSCTWAYASFQFGMVVLFAHFVYNMLNVDSILNALLSSFTGFGIAFTTNALIVECLRWRESRCLLPHIRSVTREQLRHSLHQYHQQHRPPPPPQQQQSSMENLLVEPMDGAGEVEMKIQT